MRMDGDEDDGQEDDIEHEAGQGDDGESGGQEREQETDLSAQQSDEQEDDGEQEEVTAKPSRAESRIQRLANEARTAREEAAATRRELDEFRRTQQGNRQQETQEQERQRLALMTPEERMDYRLEKAEQRHQQQVQMLSFQNEDRADKMEFAAQCATNPAYARHKDEVERRLTELRGKGQNVSREALLKFVIGEKALAGAGNKKPAQQAAKRVNAERVPAGSARGDTASSRGKGSPSLAKRLENVPI